MSKEPRPLPQHGVNPPPVNSPPPPPKRRPIQFNKCCHELHAEKLEAALREIQQLAEHPGGWGAWTAIDQIKQKCREALTTGEGE